MNVSAVITVLNEEKTIGRLLDSLLKQTRKPDEIIIVDGGSSDQTVEKLQKYKILDTKYQILIKSGANIAGGRNFGVKKARYPIIAMTDAGCVARKDWLGKLTRPFTLVRPGLSCLKGQALNTPDIVAGFYRMTGKTVFQRCLACYLGVLPEKLNPKSFLPSTRSIAFTKKIWEKVGGFNERLERTGEDTLFNYQARKLGAKFITVPDASVDWEMPKTWKEAIKKFYWYARGDVQTGIWWHPDKRLATHSLKIITIFLRYLIGLSLLVLSLRWPILLSALGSGLGVYLIWAVAKNYRYVRHWQAVFILPVLQIVSDLAVMAGFISGIMKICLQPLF